MLRSLLIVYPREDLNLWPLGPQPSALSTELRGHMLTLHGVCGHCGRIRQTSRRGGRDLNPRGMYNTPTHLAGGRTRPGYATSPQIYQKATRRMAEGEGFEPPVTLLPQLFSRQPPSSTRPSLRAGASLKGPRGWPATRSEVVHHMPTDRHPV